MKYNIFMESLGRGGAEKSLLTLINNSLKNHKNDQVTLYLFNDVKSSYTENLSNSCKLITADNKLSKLFLNPKIIKFLPRNCFYFIWLKLFYTPALRGDDTMNIAFMEGIPTKFLGAYNGENKSTWIHCDFCTNHWSKQYYLNEAEEINDYSTFSDIILVSETIKNGATQVLKIPESRIRVLNNFIDKKELKLLAKEPIDEKILDWIKEYNVYCIIGRLVKIKGILEFLKTIVKYKNELNIKFLIIGEGELENDILEIVSEHRLHEYVKLIGFTSNPYKFMKISNGLISVSKSESYGLVIEEAILLEVPVYSLEHEGAKKFESYLQSPPYSNNEKGREELLKKLNNKPLYKNDKREKYYVSSYGTTLDDIYDGLYNS
ncbi:glycosyltransferase [Exiguobacterium sp. s7]|uniref:glycosyltransferase n=1 Tax=Exiguobacterium sp. s7 TaxID=2751235 RepID=UPI001BEBDEA7|nr:glycosyltransferase [Exiguobacterium sp. s7]